MSLSRTITQKLFAIIFSCYLIMTTITLVYLITLDYSQQRTLLKEHLLTVEKMLKPSLAQALSAGRIHEIDSLLDAALQDKRLLGVKILPDSTGHIFESGQKAVNCVGSTLSAMRAHGQAIGRLTQWLVISQYKPISHRFNLLSPKSPTASHTVLAEVILISNLAVVYPQLIERAIAYLLSALVLSVSLCVLLWWSGTYLRRPLVRLTSAVQRILLEQGALEKIPYAEHGPNEIVQLTHACNQMIDRIKESQQLIESTKQHLSDIIDSSPSALIAIDTTGIVTDWNRTASLYLHCSRDAALGHPYHVVVPMLADKLHIIDRAMANFSQQERINFSREIQGKNRYFSLVTYPLFENKCIAGAVIRIDDISQQHKLEEAVVQSEKMSSVGRLAAGMAHEINNPLGAILQSTQNIHRRLDATKEKNQAVAAECGLNFSALTTYLQKRGIVQFLEGIKDSGERAAKIVSNLLRFSRRSTEHYVPVAIQDCIERAIDLIETDYNLNAHQDVKHINITREYDENLPCVFCEPTEIQQVFLNLLLNAVQALSTMEKPPKQQNIKIQATTTSHSLKIAISDNGPGMSESTKTKVFEPFFTTKDVGKGTGLGLSVTYHIVTESHGGQLTVESALGHGTTFYVHIPLTRT